MSTKNGASQLSQLFLFKPNFKILPTAAVLRDQQSESTEPLLRSNLSSARVHLHIKRIGEGAFGSVKFYGEAAMTNEVSIRSRLPVEVFSHFANLMYFNKAYFSIYA